MKERIEAVISGRVQMVTYRAFACDTARTLGIVGEVTNLPDGTVRVIAEGSRDALDTFLNRLKHGPFFARVDGMTIARKDPLDTYDRFSITYV